MSEVKMKRVENFKLARILCFSFTLVTIATILLGLNYHNPYVIIVGILPAAIYEAIRTEGFYTKAGSIAIMVLVILEILAIKGMIKVNLADFFGTTEAYFSGYIVPLGEITFIFPAVAAIISIVLFIRTYGIYTKWLAILLLASSAVLLYSVNKETFFELLRTQRYYF